MSKTKIRVIIILIIIAVCAVGAVFGYEGYKKSMYEMKRAMHPLAYSEYVEKYAEEYGMDKYVIYAVIKTESGFDPNAVSDTGARGLMQIMETTFEWIRDYGLGGTERDRSYDDMFDPETNIRYGAFLWNYLTEKFGCTETAAAAYFSGIGEVSGWVSDPAYSSDGVHLDTIPSKNAAHYVNKINTALATYRELYVQERKD